MRNLIIEFSRVTEQGALAAYPYLGRHDKNRADEASVNAMRYVLNMLDMDGEIVIGEGEIDEAPMLYNGEIVGKGTGTKVDIVVDPIDGTVLVAQGKYNSLCVIAASEKGKMLKVPEMYMEKLVVGQKAKGSINLNLPLKTNLLNIAKAYNKKLSELTVAILDRERNKETIQFMLDLGINVFTIDHGDISAGLLTCMPYSDIDVLYGIGGAPEGVLVATAMRALGGDFQGRLVHYEDVYPTDENAKDRTAYEKQKCIEMGIDINRVMSLEEIIQTDEIIFSATGVSKGDLLEGVHRINDVATTETLLLIGKTQTIRRIRSTHTIDLKDTYLIQLFNSRKEVGN